LDVEQQNALNELKGKLMKEMDDMQEIWKEISEEEHKELEEKFSQREAEIKENELREREDILNNLKTGTHMHFVLVNYKP
jgi:regulator of sigma D